MFTVRIVERTCDNIRFKHVELSDKLVAQGEVVCNHIKESDHRVSGEYIAMLFERIDHDANLMNFLRNDADENAIYYLEFSIAVDDDTIYSAVVTMFKSTKYISNELEEGIVELDTGIYASCELHRHVYPGSVALVEVEGWAPNSELPALDYKYLMVGLMFDVNGFAISYNEHSEYYIAKSILEQNPNLAGVTLRYTFPFNPNQKTSTVAIAKAKDTTIYTLTMGADYNPMPVDDDTLKMLNVVNANTVRVALTH